MNGKTRRSAIPCLRPECAIEVAVGIACNVCGTGRYTRNRSTDRVISLAWPYTGRLADQPRGGDGLSFCWTGERHYQQGGDQIKSGGGYSTVVS
ncbi:MAG: hypothetical protein OXC57_08335 [Rhodobacteraceae bacterium]|nr:hypothetical protein [Paracoccaceae bacterium]